MFSSSDKGFPTVFEWKEHDEFDPIQGNFAEKHILNTRRQRQLCKNFWRSKVYSRGKFRGESDGSWTPPPPAPKGGGGQKKKEREKGDRDDKRRGTH